jgi:L-aminopeptidase/D-esterase-like protein
VEVGHTKLISGDAASPAGVEPVRTRVTAILPGGKDSNDPVFAGWFTENGNGEMTGTTWIEESGFLEGPVMTTNTHSVGMRERLRVFRQNRSKIPGKRHVRAANTRYSRPLPRLGLSRAE